MISSGNVLPESFRPSINEVIIGRGKRIAEHCGNKRLHAIVKTFVPEYSAAPTKRQKSAILTKVVMLIRNNSIHQAGFVKQDTLQGGWCIVEDAAARITVAQAFRDNLHVNYKSSKQFKQQKRQDKKTICRQVSGSLAQPLRNFHDGNGVLSSSNVLLQTMQLTPAARAPRAVSTEGSQGAAILNHHQGPTTGNGNPGFSTLLNILEASIDLTMNPFEPTPITNPSTGPLVAPLPALAPSSSIFAGLQPDPLVGAQLNTLRLDLDISAANGTAV